MTSTKFINLITISSLLILVFSSWFTPAFSLSVDTHHLARRGHDAIALRKRSGGLTRRCINRPSNSTASATPSPSPSVTPSPSPSSAPKEISSSSSSAHSTTSSSKAVATPAPATSNTGTGTAKIGLAWANGNDPSLSQYKTANVLYIYSWSPEYPSQSKALGLIPMPMLWCYDQIGDFQSKVVRGYATIAMGPNEPNEVHQCNISPQQGAAIWQQYLEPLRDQGYDLLVSPATSSAPSGKTWMTGFFEACQGCQVDVVAAHYYDVSAQGLIAYMTDFHNTFNKPIMITEFACQNFNGGPQCTQDQVTSFMTTVLDFCHQTSWIHSCYPFGFMHDMQGVNTLDQLMGPSGAPTALGSLVINSS